ncbi:MAG: accessory Sec system glycosyltransferase GtfA [Eubacterium sp.]|nr:accessory Sec system glycosyltransferase GtfA [Eubacterium sp.]
MIYNFNLGIGWASSGVEYAQSYRANIFRRIGKDAKFIFTDMFARDNLEEMTDNLGFDDRSVIWLYMFFSDIGIAPCSRTLNDIEEMIGDRKYERKSEGNIEKYIFEGRGNFFCVYMSKVTKGAVSRVEMVSDGCLIRKDFFSDCRMFTEYYAPLDGKAHLYKRTFYNKDQSIAYDEIIDGDDVFYRFKDRIIYSKEELVGYMVSKMNLTENDIVILDRTTGIGQAVLENAGRAKVGIVIHADHFSEGGTDEDNILWNNYYEYSFANHERIDFYVTATDEQNKILKEQFKKYMGIEKNIVTIPVGSIDELIFPKEERRPNSFITASRLASEKHIDRIIEGICEAKKTVKDVSLDIYGEGVEREELSKLIKEKGAESYIRLMGQQDLKDVYKKYFAYISGSTSEGFGLTYLEALGSGLPIIGFDARYGIQCFVDEGENGYRLSTDENISPADRTKMIADAIIKLCKNEKIDAFRRHSYKIATKYLTKEVEKKWQNLTEQII